MKVSTGVLRNVALAAMIFVLVVGGYFGVGYVSWRIDRQNRGLGFDEKQIVAAADKFKAPADWKLVSEQVVKPDSWCVGQACPSVHREWQLPRQYSNIEINAIAKDSGYALDIKDECKINTLNYSYRQSICSWTLSESKYYTSFDQMFNKDLKTYSFNMFIKEQPSRD